MRAANKRYDWITTCFHDRSALRNKREMNNSILPDNIQLTTKDTSFRQQTPISIRSCMRPGVPMTMSWMKKKYWNIYFMFIKNEEKSTPYMEINKHELHVASAHKPSKGKRELDITYNARFQWRDLWPFGGSTIQTNWFNTTRPTSITHDVWYLQNNESKPLATFL